MIEFKLALHIAVARKRYYTIKSATLIVDIDGFQTDWQLIWTSNFAATESIDYVIIYIQATP